MPPASDAAPRKQRRGELVRRDALRQVRHDEPHEPVDQDLHHERDEPPGEDVGHRLRMHDRARQRQREADQAEAERERRRHHVLADQRELVMRRRERIDDR
jgi:hypothetical protein